MQIKIEIDVKPEELRRFLGLPDVAGLQDDVIRFLRDKVEQAGESFDAAAVVQGSVDLLKRTPAWRLWVGSKAAESGRSTQADETREFEAAPQPKRASRKRVRRHARKAEATVSPLPDSES